MNLEEYHKATTRELLALTDRVRNLIYHWGEDGRYKEEILKNVIRRFLPQKYSIGTGFVIIQTDSRDSHKSSNQIDLIIYDNEFPVIFKEGDFVILTPDAVKGIIEVKANLRNQGLEKVLTKANENGKFIFSGKKDKSKPIFNGVFSYENQGFKKETLIRNYNKSNVNFENIQDYKKFKVNHVVLDKDWFIKFWVENPRPHSIYKIEDLAFSYFISNLVDFVSNKSVENNNFIWYPRDKEPELIDRF